MKLISVAISNFNSIENIQLGLDRKGLALVLGKNSQVKQYSNNGSGKTSMFEAISWCLFGKTMHNRPIAEYVRTGSPGLDVSVILDPEDGTEPLTVKRSHAKKKTTLNVVNANGDSLFPGDTDSVQTGLQQWLGLDYEVFINSVFFGQGLGKFFMYASDAERKDLLDTILQMVSFEDAQERAKKAKAAKEKAKSESEQAIAEIKVKLTAEKQNLTEAANNLVAREATLAALKDAKVSTADVANLKMSLQKLEIALGTHNEGVQAQINKAEEFSEATKKEALEAVKAKVTAAKETFKSDNDTLLADTAETVEGITKELEEAKKVSKDASEHWANLKSEVLAEQASLNKLAEAAERCKNLEPDNPCPLCRQDISEEYVQNVTSSYDIEIAKSNQMLATLQRNLEKYSEEIKPLDKIISDLEASLKSANTKAVAKQAKLKEALDKNLESIEEEKNAALALITANLKKTCDDIRKNSANTTTDLTAKISAIHVKMGKAEEEANSHKEKVATAEEEVKKVKLLQKNVEAKITKLKQELKTTETQIKGIEEALERITFWVEAFGPRGIRSFVFDEALPYLTERANFYSTYLTGGTISIDILSTVKTKTTDNVKQNLTIKTENSMGSPSFIGNSAGEKRRVDLCILLALRDLVATRSKRVWNTIIFDEIFDTLDEAGIDCVIDLYRSMPDLAIFVISHSAALKSHFDECIVVEKKNGISSLKAA